MLRDNINQKDPQQKPRDCFGETGKYLIILN